MLVLISHCPSLFVVSINQDTFHLPTVAIVTMPVQPILHHFASYISSIPVEIKFNCDYAYTLAYTCIF